MRPETDRALPIVRDDQRKNSVANVPSLINITIRRRIRLTSHKAIFHVYAYFISVCTTHACQVRVYTITHFHKIYSASSPSVSVQRPNIEHDSKPRYDSMTVQECRLKIPDRFDRIVWQIARNIVHARSTGWTEVKCTEGDAENGGKKRSGGNGRQTFERR